MVLYLHQKIGIIKQILKRSLKQILQILQVSLH